MIFDGDKAQIGPYLRALADLMGLKDWEIFVSETPPDNPNHAATCGTYYGRKKAKISFAGDWALFTSDEFRATCAHELIHCHFRPMEEIVANLESFLGNPAYNITKLAYKDVMEYAVDGIAVAWARTLPLPVKAGAREFETKDIPPGPDNDVTRTPYPVAAKPQVDKDARIKELEDACDQHAADFDVLLKSYDRVHEALL